MLEKILKFKELQKFIPISRSTLWRYIKANKFPKPVVLNPSGTNTIRGWTESEVIAWLEQQKSKSIVATEKNS